MSGLHTRDIHGARPILEVFQTILDVILDAILVGVVGSGWILLSVDADLDGFDRFWTSFWVVAVRSGWILISVDAGLDGFDRFWTILDVILGRSGPVGLDTYFS